MKIKICSSSFLTLTVTAFSAKLTNSTRAG